MRFRMVVPLGLLARIGALEYRDGVPTAATDQKSYDFFSREWVPGEIVLVK